MSKLSLPEQKEIIDELVNRFFVSGPNIRANSFRELILKRRAHFHMLREMDPVLFGALAGLPRFQSDLPRKKHSELKARITENHFVLRVRPIKNTAKQSIAANRFEQVLNSGLLLVEERNGYSLQGGLADGQIVDGLGILHWRMAEEMYPEYPEAQLVPSVGADERKRFYRIKEEDGNYRERAESLKERRRVQMARSGFPWIVEVVDPTMAAWIEDTWGLAVMMTVEILPFVRYAQAQSQQGIALSLNDQDKSIQVYRERAIVPEYGDSLGRYVAVAKLWTRDCFYELASAATSGYNVVQTMGWEEVNAFEHPYEMPPFAVCPAQDFLHGPPELRYIPSLEGLFRLKPTYDRSVTLMLGMQEQGAQPVYFLKKTGSGEPLLDEGGNQVYLTNNAATAEMIPEGYELAKVEFVLEPGFVQGVGFLRQEFIDAAPSTGRAPYGSSTQPWSFRLALEQENVEPKTLIDHQGNALQKMARNMALVMSKSPAAGGPADGETVVFARSTDGKLERDKLVSVAYDEIQTLDIESDINPSSGSERVALTEHLRALLNDPKVPMTPIKYLEEADKSSNPYQEYADWKAWQIFESTLLPAIIQQETAKVMATQIALGPNGSMIGPNGEQLTPEQVLQANGQQPAIPSPEAAGGQGPPSAPQPPGAAPVGAMNSPRAPSLPPLATPGTMPRPGMPG